MNRMAQLVKKRQLAVNMLAYEAVMNETNSQADFFEEVADLGVTKIEVRREYIHQEQDFSAIQRKASQLGIEIFYAVPEILFEVELIPQIQLEEYFKEAQQLGAKQIKFTAGYTKEVTLQEVQLLTRLIKNYGIENLTLENGQDSSFAEAETVHQFIQALKEKQLPVSVTFDTGNCLYVNEDPLESFMLLKEDVSYVHLKDVSKDTLTPTLNGEGDVPLADILSQVSETVNIAIEYPLGEDPTAILAEEIAKIS